MRSILNEAKIGINIYTSPHIQRINERFIFNNEGNKDENLYKLLKEVEQILGEKITFFEILTCTFMKKAGK